MGVWRWARAEFLISLSAIKNERVDQELTKSVTCLFLSGVFGGKRKEGGRTGCVYPFSLLQLYLRFPIILEKFFMFGLFGVFFKPHVFYMYASSVLCCQG